MKFLATTTNRHQSSPYGLEFTLSQGQSVPSEVSYNGEKYSVAIHAARKTATSSCGTQGRIYKLPFATDPDAKYEIHLTPGGRLVFDAKHAVGRRAKRLARRAAAKQKRYGWKEFARTGRTVERRNSNNERAIATNRKAQRKLERWVKKVGLWRLGFDRDIHYVVDARKFGGFDFEIREKIGHKLVALVDAKSEMKTTHAQDKQIAASWKYGIACYLVSRTSYLQLTQMTKRVPNGSIWG